MTPIYNTFADSLRRAREQGREDVLSVVRSMLPAADAFAIEARVTTVEGVAAAVTPGGDLPIPPWATATPSTVAAALNSSPRKAEQPGQVEA